MELSMKYIPSSGAKRAKLTLLVNCPKPSSFKRVASKIVHDFGSSVVIAPASFYKKSSRKCHECQDFGKQKFHSIICNYQGDKN